MKQVLSAATGLAILWSVVVVGQAALIGTWEGETGQGRLIALEVKAEKDTLTGGLSVDGRTALFKDGKMTGKTTFTFMASLDGATRTFMGELVGDELRLTFEGARAPAILRRPAFKPPTTQK